MAVYKFAGFWRRFVAYTVDNIITIIINKECVAPVLLSVQYGAV